MNFKGKKIAILGWGINGLDAYHYLSKKGAEIVIFDKKEKKDLDLNEVEEGKVKFVLGERYLDNGLKDFDYVFRTPAVYPFFARTKRSRKKGSSYYLYN